MRACDTPTARFSIRARGAHQPSGPHTTMTTPHTQPTDECDRHPTTALPQGVNQAESDMHALTPVAARSAQVYSSPIYYRPGGARQCCSLPIATILYIGILNSGYHSEIQMRCRTDRRSLPQLSSDSSLFASFDLRLSFSECTSKTKSVTKGRLVEGAGR